MWVDMHNAITGRHECSSQSCSCKLGSWHPPGGLLKFRGHMLCVYGRGCLPNQALSMIWTRHETSPSSLHRLAYETHLPVSDFTRNANWGSMIYENRGCQHSYQMYDFLSISHWKKCSLKKKNHHHLLCHLSKQVELIWQGGRRDLWLPRIPENLLFPSDRWTSTAGSQQVPGHSVGLSEEPSYCSKAQAHFMATFLGVQTYNQKAMSRSCHQLAGNSLHNPEDALVSSTVNSDITDSHFMDLTHSHTLTPPTHTHSHTTKWYSKYINTPHDIAPPPLTVNLDDYN